MSQEPYSDFIQVARQGKNHWSIYLVTLIIVMVMTMIIGNIPVAIPMLKHPDKIAQFQTEGFNPEVLGLSPEIGLLLIIFPFALGLFTLIFCVVKLHKRPGITLFTSRPSINWKKILFAAGLWFAFSGILEGINYLMNPEVYSWTFDAGKFFPVMVVALLFLPLQTTFEELMFRSYLLQGLSMATKRKWIALLITSTIFGLMHIMNPEVSEYGNISLLYYIGMGIFLGLLTLMDDSAEIAIGVHAGNNIFGAIIVTFPDSVLQFPTLFRAEEMNFMGSMIGWAGAAIVFYFVMARIYKWGNYKKLFEKITSQNPQIEKIGTE